MTTTAPEKLDLQRAARDHLWLHFTRMGGYHDGEVPIIVRGDGCYLEDSKGKRYLDALAGLFSVNIGYGFGEEIGEAAAAQMRELPFYTNWSYAHPRAIELASEVASLAPGDLNRLFFVSGGSEAVESAWKLARQYYSARGEMRSRVARIPGQRVDPVVDYDAAEAAALSTGRRWKAISRHIAYHGTTMGALSINGIPASAHPFRAARARRAARAEHESVPPPAARDRSGVHRVPPRRPRAHDRGGRPGDRGDGDHGAGAKCRRRLHAAGGLLARRAGALRPLRHPALRGRGHHRLRHGSARGSGRSATTFAPI